MYLNTIRIHISFLYIDPSNSRNDATKANPMRRVQDDVIREQRQGGLGPTMAQEHCPHLEDNKKKNNNNSKNTLFKGVSETPIFETIVERLDGTRAARAESAPEGEE